MRLLHPPAFTHQIPLTRPLPSSDVLHPDRPNVSKDELRQKLSELYKAPKDAVSVFGFRTQYGGGKSTGFALVYDSPDSAKKFEPRYRLVRYGLATKVEKASRQQRTYRSRPRRIGSLRPTPSGPLCIRPSADGRVQASSARTDPRNSGVRRRLRVERRKRAINRRGSRVRWLCEVGLHYVYICSCCTTAQLHGGLRLFFMWGWMAFSGSTQIA